MLANATTPTQQTVVSSPNTLWAQREGELYITIQVSDIKDEKIDLTETGLHFSGRSESSGANYKLDMEFFGPIDIEKSKKSVSDRHIYLVLAKKESGPYWPRLMKESGKYHFLKTDFSKWKDEDEEDEEQQSPMNGGMDFMGMGGGAGNDFSNFDFSQFAGAGGLGAMGGADDAQFEDSDDEEGLPELVKDDEEEKTTEA